MAARIADAMPGTLFAALQGCGHLAYLERPGLVHESIAALINAR
ncbi:MAG: hypothetical protein ACM3ML_07745 [Micromonosporaceae bacterium]